jgi:CelD/BcsL family acetyltransferase involved in cellulose biosynthesis
VLRRSGKVIGLAPLCIEKRLGFRILRFIADDRSDYLGFLRDPDDLTVAPTLMAGLARHSQHWDLMVLRRLAEPFTSLHKAPQLSSSYWHQAEWTTSAFCRCDGDFEALHASGPSWIREMPRRRRRFMREGGTALHFSGVDAVEQLSVVAQIEAASWKGSRGQTRLQPGHGQDIFRRAFMELGDQIQLWLAFMEGKPVAYQIDFLCGDRIWLYQCGYDETYRKARAGSVLAYIATEHAWAGGVREYDYLTGDEPYKLVRTSELRPIYHLAGQQRTARGWLAYGLLILPRWKLRKVPVLRSIRDRIASLRMPVKRT